EHVLEGGEWTPVARRGHPCRLETGPRQRGQRLTAQPRASDASRPRDDDAAPGLHRGTDELELRRPTDECNHPPPRGEWYGTDNAVARRASVTCATRRRARGAQTSAVTAPGISSSNSRAR